MAPAVRLPVLKGLASQRGVHNQWCQQGAAQLQHSTKAEKQRVTLQQLQQLAETEMPADVVEDCKEFAQLVALFGREGKPLQPVENVRQLRDRCTGAIASRGSATSSVVSCTGFAECAPSVHGQGASIRVVFPAYEMSASAVADLQTMVRQTQSLNLAS